MPQHYKTQIIILHFILNEFIWKDVLIEQITTESPLTEKSTIFNTDYAPTELIFQNKHSLTEQTATRNLVTINPPISI